MALHRRRPHLCLVVVLSALTCHQAAAVDFERDVAPILEQHCLRCHNDAQPKGDFSLSTRAAALDSGYLVPSDASRNGTPGGSGRGIRRTAADAQRGRAAHHRADPPAHRVGHLRRSGAPWPEDVRLEEPAGGDASWWSFQPIQVLPPPDIDGTLAGWAETPVDRFVAAKLVEQGLAPAPRSDRRTLIRRATYDLTGLPPTPEDVERFLADDSPGAWPRLVDRLLASPHYGERWGRHWLDVVRFGESNGFERNAIWNNVWPFRDYVIRSFNEDKPADQFIREHLAGDVLADGDPRVEIGTAFLVCGPYDDVGNQDAVQAAQIRANTIDEMIRATGEAFLGLTVGCARCHNHKFDPIRQQDYYALYATFAGVRHGSREIAAPEVRARRDALLRPLQQQQRAVEEQLAELETAIVERAEGRADQYEAMWTRPAVSRYGTEETFDPIEAKAVRLIVDSRDDNPAARTGFVIDEFEVWTDEESPRNVAAAVNGGVATGVSRVAEDFAEAYGPRLTIDGRFDARWISRGPELTVTFERPERIGRVYFSSDRRRLLGRHSKTVFVGDYRIEASLDGVMWQVIADTADRKPPTANHRRARLLEQDATAEETRQLADLRRERNRINREIAEVPALPSWWAGTFRPAAGPFHVFLGGDPQKPGPPAVPASLSVLQESSRAYRLTDDQPESQRRLALANWITADDNPLTARVLANRVWHYHFGTGLVASPSDFGAMGQPPTHPHLLDWLAGELLRSGWSLKHLHRQILLSATYRQSSRYQKSHAAIDGDSRYLWRVPPRRLSAEEIRDTMLSVRRTSRRPHGRTRIPAVPLHAGQCGDLRPARRAWTCDLSSCCLSSERPRSADGLDDRLRLPGQLVPGSPQSLDDDAVADAHDDEPQLFARRGGQNGDAPRTGISGGSQRAGPTALPTRLFASAHRGRTGGCGPACGASRAAGALPGGRQFERVRLSGLRQACCTLAKPVCRGGTCWATSTRGWWGSVCPIC